MALENILLRPRVGTFVARQGFQNTLAKSTVRQTLIDTADKLVVGPVVAPTTVADILGKAQAAATPFKADVASKVVELAGGPDAADALRKLYLANAEKAVATLDPGLDEALG